MTTVTAISALFVLVAVLQCYSNGAVLSGMPVAGSVYEYSGGPRGSGPTTITKFLARKADPVLEGEDEQEIFEYVGGPRNGQHTAISAYGKKMSPSNLRLFKLSEFFHRKKSSPRASTREEIKEFNRSKWIEYKFLPTPGLQYDSSHGLNPLVSDWRFSPSGRTGVSIIKGINGASIVMLLDVHNKLWFGNSVDIPGLEDYKASNIFRAGSDASLKNIFAYIHTYHMLNQSTLIVVELSESNVVKQHIIKVDLETRAAEFEETKVHEFVRREEVPQPLDELTAPNPHIPITVEGKSYTVVEVKRNVDVRGKLDLFLVPLNPLNTEIKPMEFSYLIQFSAELMRKISLLTESDEQHNMFSLTGYSSGGLLYFPVLVFAGPPPLIGQHPKCGHFTVDISKLIDIHEKPIENMGMNQYIVDSSELVLHNLVEFIADENLNNFNFNSVFNSSMVIFPSSPSDKSRRTYYTHCQLLESMRTLKIENYRNTFLCLHPGGSVLQFMQFPDDRRLFGKVAAYGNTSLESLTSSKLIFHPKRTIDSIEGLHRIIFGLKPISLDLTARRVLAAPQDIQLVRFRAYGILAILYCISIIVMMLI